MATVRLGGPALPLNLNNALASQIPNPTNTSSFANPTGASNAVTLTPGQTVILPAGTYVVLPGPYTSLQFLDPVSNFWRNYYSGSNSDLVRVESDGGNIRLANLTGIPVGALITNAGAAAAYTNGIGTAITGCTITPSAGGSLWVPVVGGAINSTVAITAGGTGYTLPPILVFSAPPQGGIQATGTCTIVGGVVTTVTVTNQGGGYVTPPTVTVFNDPRDTVGAGCVLTVNATLVSSGQLVAMYPAWATGNLGFGNPVTALPTFTFSPASTTAAVAVMNWVVTSIGVTKPGAGGTGYTSPTTALVISGSLVAGTRASNVAGPIADIGLTQPRPAFVQMALSVGTINTTGHIVIDAGYGFQAVPTVNLLTPTGGAGPTTFPALNAQVGGVTDTSWVQPF